MEKLKKMPMIEWYSQYAYTVIDFFLPVIFVCIYFPFIMSKKTEKVCLRIYEKIKECCRPSGSN